jgi:hypothetical protein
MCKRNRVAAINEPCEGASDRRVQEFPDPDPDPDPINQLFLDPDPDPDPINQLFLDPDPTRTRVVKLFWTRTRTDPDLVN